ncbi:MAG: S9 family peptidase [bacterium]|nr:S9 family peptidase [bacterium]
MTRTRLIVVVAAVICLGLSAYPAESAGMNPKQVAEIQQISSVAMAPDGSRVAAVRSVPRMLFEDDNGSNWAELLVFDPASGAMTPFVTGHVNVSSVKWLPDSSAISFLAKREDDDHKSLYLIPVDGGEASRVLALETAISDYSWSPDGKRVAAIASEPKCSKREDLADKGFNQKIYEEDWQQAKVWVASPFGDGESDPEALSLEGSAIRVLWSPKGDKLAVTLAPSPLVDDRYMFQKVNVVSVDSGEVIGKIDNEGKMGRMAWSPDGTHVAFISGADINDPAAGSLMLASAEGGAPTNLTEGFEGSVSSIVWTDDRTILCLVSKGVDTALYRANLRNHGFERLGWTDPKAVFTSMSVSRDGSKIALVGSSPSHPSELFTADSLEIAPQRLTDSNPWLADVDLGKREVVRYSARDGLEIEGLLVYPADYVKGTRYPLVMCVHGGPEAHHRNGWLTRYSNPAQVLAARGFAVFFTNYRGSTGRGVAFSKLGQKDPAGGEFDDLVDAVDHLIEKGLVDKDKVGVTGGSYGGYATAWLTTRYSERFAAGVMFVGISDLISKAGTTDIPEEEYLVHALQRPHDDFSFYLERSPIAHVSKGRTPLLILGGEDDPRVDPGQSKEMYRALKVEGKTPVRLVIYPGEGHGNRKLAARYDYSLRMLRWMEHYLKGPGGEMPHWGLEYQLPSDGWPEPETEEESVN